MNRISLTYLLFLLNILLLAQNPDDKIDFNNFNAEYLEFLMNTKLNEHRKSLGVHILKSDSILKLAAEDQAKYMKKISSITHIQKKKKKESPFKRVKYYGGTSSIVGENVHSIIIGESTKIFKEKRKIVINTYEEAANALIKSWINSKEHHQNMINNDYYKVGSGVALDKKHNTIYATQVFASEPYKIPKNIKFNKNDFNIKIYDNSTCKAFLKKFSYLPVLWSNNLYIHNGYIFFYYHDLDFFKKVFDKRKDKLSVDIINRNQFPCNTGNMLYNSPVHSGIMLKPVKKGKILKHNPLKKENEIIANLGKLPPNIDSVNYEFNLLIIKNNHICSNIIYNNVQGMDIMYIPVNFIMDTLTISSNKDSAVKELIFKIYFKKNKYNYNTEDIKDFLDSLEINRYDIKKIKINAYASVEGDSINNMYLQRKRAESILKAIEMYKLNDIKKEIFTAENWHDFMKDIKKSDYYYLFKNKNKNKIRQILNNNDTLLEKLEPLLAKERKAIVKIWVKNIYLDSNLAKILPFKLEKAIKNNDITSAKIYYSMILKLIFNNKISESKLLSIKIPFKKEFSSLLNNNEVLKNYLRNNFLNNNFDTTFIMKLRKIAKLDPSNMYVKYNLLSFKLYKWSQDLNLLEEPKNLYKAIRKLYNSKIEGWKINSLLLNYYIIAANYYYEKKEYEKRLYYLKKIYRYFKRTRLNMKQSYQLANYFISEMQIDWAISIMLPWIKKGVYDEDFFFKFLSIAIYDKKQVPQKKFFEYMKKAKEINKERFCNLFGYPNMSFQLLRFKEIKTEYCKTCFNKEYNTETGENIKKR